MAQNTSRLIDIEWRQKKKTETATATMDWKSDDISTNQRKRQATDSLNLKSPKQFTADDDDDDDDAFTSVHWSFYDA